MVVLCRRLLALLVSSAIASCAPQLEGDAGGRPDGGPGHDVAPVDAAVIDGALGVDASLPDAALDDSGPAMDGARSDGGPASDARADTDGAVARDASQPDRMPTDGGAADAQMDLDGDVAGDGSLADGHLLADARSDSGGPDVGQPADAADDGGQGQDATGGDPGQGADSGHDVDGGSPPDSATRDADDDDAGVRAVLPRFDVNGDGAEDVLLVAEAADGTWAGSLLLSNGAGFEDVCPASGDAPCGVGATAALSHPDTRVLPGDYDGDGRSDLLIISADPQQPGQRLLLSNGAELTVACSGSSDGTCGLDTEPYMRHRDTRFISGDYDADGRTDLLIISGDPTFLRRILLRSTGAGFTVACVGSVDGACGFDNEPYMRHRHTRMLPGDYDGDGRADLLIISGDPSFPRRMLLRSTGSSFAIACVGNNDGACGLDTEPYLTHSATRILPGDLDGDGRTDLLVISGDPALPRRVVLRSTGAALQPVCVSDAEVDAGCGLADMAMLRDVQTKVIPGDYDGDGRMDLLVLSGWGSAARRELLRSLGDTFAVVCSGTTDGACGFDSESYIADPATRLLAGDFTADGRTDLLVISGEADFPRRALLESRGASFVPACVGQEPQACGVPAAVYADGPSSTPRT